MTQHKPGQTPESLAEERPQHAPLVPDLNVQGDGQDEGASDIDNTEYTQDTKYGSAKHLIASSTFMNGFLIDVLSVLVAVAFLVFAIMGIQSKDNEIGQREATLLNAARIIATGFPYCFALVFGRTLQNILSSRMEIGVDCLTHAYLSRSLTLGGTLVAPIHIRLGHWLPAVLIVLWGFSPLGSQASLRFISLQTRATHDQLGTPAHYSYPQAFLGPHFEDREAKKAMFLAAFLPLAKTGPSFQDTWGNIKIPLLKDTNNTSNADGWRGVSWHPDMQYSSLIGIPLSLPPSHGNMSFTMETWYWELENSTLWGANTSQPLLLATHEYNNSFLLANYTGESGLWQLAIPMSLSQTAVRAANIDPLGYANISISEIPVTFEVQKPRFYPTKNNKGYNLRLEASLVQKHVELNVSCTVTSCNVTDIRTNQTANENQSRLNQDYFLLGFLNNFRNAFPTNYDGMSSSGALEAYLANPSQNSWIPVEGGQAPGTNLIDIGAEDLGRRLTQVINAYWMVDTQSFQAVGGFNASSDANSPWLGVSQGPIRNSTVTATNYQGYLHCDYRWATALCISSIMLLLAALASTILSFFRLAPDCTDFLSALTLNDGRMMLEGGSSLDEYDRVRLLKDVRLKIGDSRSWEQIGHTSIAQDRHVGDLKKKRLYW
ncbi:uncharacterized protein PG998_003064 [Apiospora kogelbergensis]|uniref:uncharacterized protein n=1 Tax=Apiospora kogelbergensis TaxID=1337665 RepID=UPI00312CEA7C